MYFIFAFLQQFAFIYHIITFRFPHVRNVVWFTTPELLFFPSCQSYPSLLGDRDSSGSYENIDFGSNFAGSARVSSFLRSGTVTNLDQSDCFPTQGWQSSDIVRLISHEVGGVLRAAEPDPRPWPELPEGLPEGLTEFHVED